MAGNKLSKEDSLSGILKILVKTSFIVFIGLVISKILGYLFRIIIARYFGPEVYGLFSLSLAILGTAGAIVALGLNEGLLRFIPIYRVKKKINEIRYTLKFVLKAYFILGVLGGCLLFFFSNYISINFFHNINLSIYLKILSFALPISFFSNVFLSVLRAYEEVSWYSLINNILQNVARVLSLIILIFLGINSISVPISFLISIISIFLIAYFVCRVKTPEVFGKYLIKNKSKTKKSLLAYSLPIMFYSIIASVFFWIDSFSLGFYKDVSAVGIYNAAIPIVALIAIVPELFMNLFFPIITKYFAHKNFNLIEQLSKQVNKWIFVINVPLFILIIVFPGAVINLLFGSQYLAATNALRILAIGALVSSVTVIPNQLMAMAGKSKLILLNILISAIVNFSLNSLFIPMQKILFLDNSNGLVGAALATLISLIVFSLLFFIQVYSSLKIIPLRKKMILIFFIGIVSSAILVYLRNIFTSSNLFILGLLTLAFLIIYVTLIILSKSLDENDLNILKAIKTKLSRLI